MSEHSSEEAAIRQSHQASIDALHRGDVKAWAAHFVQDADYVDSLVVISKGRAKIEQRFQELLTGPLQGAKFENNIESIRFPTPTVPIIDITAGITPKQGPPRTLRAVGVLLKQDGLWVSAAGRSWVPATVPV